MGFERVNFGVTFALLCLVCGAMSQENSTDPEHNIHNEKECAYQGGMCVLIDDCPKGSLTATKGLCPEQRHKGVECCYGIPISYTTCKSRGGECMPIIDCPAGGDNRVKCPTVGDTCCIMVR